MDGKSEVRNCIKKRLLSLDLPAFSSQGEAAGAVITAGEEWNRARTILLFMSMPGEIETHSLLETALLERKTLFIPRIIEKTMCFFSIDSIDGPWEKGPFGIREPVIREDRRFYPGKTGGPVLAIVPGLAFDRLGNRLGRGGGYYDRFLREVYTFYGPGGMDFFALGLCLREQLIDSVPTGEFDQRVDAICAGNDYININ